MTASDGLQFADPVAVDPEVALWAALKEDPASDSREELFGRYYGFARTVARRIFRRRNRGDLEFDDLCQLASTGLLEAIDSFDPDRGRSFEAYAQRRISGSVLDGLKSLNEFREQSAFRHRVRRDRVKSLDGGTTHHAKGGEALAELVELAVGLAIGFMLDDTSLYRADDVDDAHDAYGSLAWKQTIKRLLREVEQLPDRQRRIVRLHYLEGVGFDRIGAVLSLSKARISQLHRDAILELRTRLAAVGEFHLEL